MSSNLYKRISKILKTKEFWTIFLITLIGAFLRFYKLRQLMVFLGDEGRDALLVKRLIIDHDPILVGPTTSVGKIQLPPLYYYFMAPWLSLFKLDPIGPAIGVALLGTLTIPLFYFVAYKILNKKAALFGTILYTTAWVVISYTRFSWNPNPMPFVVLLLIYNLYKVWQDKSLVGIISVFIFFALALQLHYMVILLVPFLALFIGISFWHVRSNFSSLKKLSIGIIVGFTAFLILLSPLFIFEFRHNFINFRGLTEFFIKGHHTDSNLLRVIRDLEGRSYQVVGDVLGFSKGPFRNWFAKVVIIGFLVLSFIKKQKEKGLIFLSCWLVLGILGLAIYKGDVYYHYLGFMFPLPFLILGYSLSFLWGKSAGKILAILILIILLGNNLYRSPAWGNLGWNIDNVKDVAETITRECPGKNYNVVLIDSTRDYRAMNYRYFLEILRCPPLVIEDYPKAETLYIISQEEIIDFDTLDLWEIRSQGESLKALEHWKFKGGPFMYKLVKARKKGVI